MSGTRDLRAVQRAVELAHPLPQRREVVDDLALGGDARRELAAPRSRVEVRVRVRSGELLDVSFDADLMARGLPVERPGGGRTARELPSLAALVVREEADPPIVNPPAEDHAAGGATVGADRRQRHRLRLARARRARFFEPRGQRLQGTHDRPPPTAACASATRASDTRPTARSSVSGGRNA